MTRLRITVAQTQLPLNHRDNSRNATCCVLHCGARIFRCTVSNQVDDFEILLHRGEAGAYQVHHVLESKKHRIEAQLPTSQVAASCRTIVCRLNAEELDIVYICVYVDYIRLLRSVFILFFLCLGPVEELEVLQPTCATVDSRLLSSTKSKDIKGHRNAFEMHDTS